MKYSFEHLKNKVAVLTGGAGVIGTAIATGLAESGIKMAILDINEEAAVKVAEDIKAKTGTDCVGLACNVLDKDSLIQAKEKVHATLGPVDILINGAGGNSPKATTKVETIENVEKDFQDSFFGLDSSGFDWVFDLNFKGTLLPTMVFGEELVRSGKGSILNVSSMNSYRPLTKIPAYSAAKSSINNFTQWLSVHFAKTGVRVNAVAPGFFLTNQNRFLLTDKETGEMTPRGKKIIDNTPMGRYGEVDELIGTCLYLVSDLAQFVTGIVIPVDGGYSAFGGV
ncbi:SDR family oxidoreductase [Saccharicrinis sp. FJH2]|uniref:SDR family oxidoreductase n=1 Tax=unclassified Saccharicrinis TaxID=2646859 RepID=UPI0035D443EB